MSIPTVDSWSPADSLLTIGGVNINGFVDGTYIEIKRNNPAATMKEGEDGGVTVNRSLKKSGTITITTRRGAPINTYLGQLAAAFELKTKGAAKFFDIQYENSNSPTSAHCDEAFFSQIPDLSDSADGGPCKWVVMCPIMEYLVAGAEG